MTPGVNVWVASFRGDHVHHGAASQWLRQRLNAAQTKPDLALQPTVTASFLRLVTNPWVFANPLHSGAAQQCINGNLADSGVSMLTVRREWLFLHNPVAVHQRTGHAVQVARIAACVIQKVRNPGHLRPRLLPAAAAQTTPVVGLNFVGNFGRLMSKNAHDQPLLNSWFQLFN